VELAHDFGIEGFFLGRHGEASESEERMNRAGALFAGRVHPFSEPSDSFWRVRGLGGRRASGPIVRLSSGGVLRRCFCGRGVPVAETAPARIVSGGHPGLPPDAPQEIRGRGNPAENGAHMPFGGNARRDRAGALSEHDAEALFGLYMDRSTEERFRRRFVRARASIGGK
jgi:hypothetical protein